MKRRTRRLATAAVTVLVAILAQYEVALSAEVQAALVGLIGAAVNGWMAGCDGGQADG